VKFLFATSLVATNAMNWVTEPDCPSLLSSVGAAVYGDSMIIFGRDGVGAAESAKIPRYHIPTQTWDYATPRPLPGNHHCGIQIDSKTYVFGGRWQGSAGAVQMYDWLTNKWTVLAPFDQNGKWIVGALSCGLIDGKVYVAGGEVEGALDAYGYAAAYDVASNTWDFTLPDMPIPVHHATYFVHNKEFYVMGGRGSGADGKKGIDTAQVYNPTSKTWRTSISDPTIPKLEMPRTATGPGVWYGDEIFILGGGAKSGIGANELDIFPQVSILNPYTKTWRRGPDMITPREAMNPVLYQKDGVAKIYATTSSRSMSWDYSGINEALILDGPIGGHTNPPTTMPAPTTSGPTTNGPTQSSGTPKPTTSTTNVVEQGSNDNKSSASTVNGVAMAILLALIALLL